MSRVEFNPLLPQVSRGAVAGFGEAVGAGFTTAYESGQAADAKRALATYAGWTPVFEKIGLGDLEVPDDIFRDFVAQDFQPDDVLLERMTDYFVNNPQLGIEISEDMALDRVAERRTEQLAAATEEVEGAQEVLGRARPGTAAAGQLVGGVGAEFLDPVNIATLPIGAPARLGILGTAAVEGVVNASLEGFQNEARNRIAAQLGLPETGLTEAMITGALFGAVTGGTMRAAQEYSPQVAQAVGRLFRTREDKAALAETFRNDENPDLAAVAESVARDIEEEDLANTRPSPERNVEHTDRFQEATAAAREARQPEINDRPTQIIPRGSIINGEIEEVDPQDLEVQPEVFQFKSDANAAGVTAKLAEVNEWNTERAGVILVFEYENGTRAVADGHQRTSLANRIMQANPDQQIRMAARVFREADGFTPEKVREIAALKNISEAADGMTQRMARDAAKVLRTNPDALMQLPQGPGIGRAQDLSRLGDDAFQLVINEVIPDAFAASIGRRVEDPAMQMAMVRLIERANPSTQAQADSIIEQALAAPVNREVTEDLFGEQEIAESLFLERAKVLERALRLMRDDQRTFRTLQERQSTIESAGNQLRAETNAEMRKRLEEAITAAERLAYRAGPISEALDNGARTYKDSGRLKDSASAVVDAIRNELERNGLSGAGARSPRRNAEPQGPGAEAPDPNQGFSDPVEGPDIDRQIANTRDALQSRSNTFVAIRRETGEVIGEVGSDAGLRNINQDNVALVPASDYLMRFNQLVTKAGGVDPEREAVAREFGSDPVVERDADQGQPQRQSEEIPEGEQLLIDNVQPITARDRVQAAADRPLLAPTRTTDTEIGGMFDPQDPARAVPDMFDQVPVGVRMNEEGQTVSEMVSVEDLAAELDADDEFAEQLGLCLR